MRSPSPAQWRQANVDAVRASAGVADQDNTCANGTPGCPGPNSRASRLPCTECFLGGGEADV